MMLCNKNLHSCKNYQYQFHLLLKDLVHNSADESWKLKKENQGKQKITHIKLHKKAR